MTISVRRTFAVMLVGALALAACVPSGQGGDAEPGGAADPNGSPGARVADPTPDPRDQLRVSTTGWATDFDRHDVPLGEFFSGGPGKDGIPAIDEPKFEAASDVVWLEDQEPVIAFGIDGDWRAYPIQVLMWHEIANDVVAGTPVSVTFCPLCHTAIVFDRTVDGTVLDFGVSGNLRHSDMVMYDRQTESWWQQATGRAVVGTYTGTQLEFLPSSLISWAQFLELHPDGTVLSRDTGHLRTYGNNPYAGYDRVDSTPFLLLDRTLLDGRLNPKVRVIGIVEGDESVAYPLPDLANATVVNDEVGDRSIVILWAPGTASGLGAATVAGGELVGTAVVFDRTLEDGTLLEFEPADAGRMTDTETGSTWDLGGTAVAGPLLGTTLEPVINDQPFWFAWAIFQPETEIRTP